jgi:hypothetical protein
MAIKDFKSILDKTGYYVSETDRKIFERGSLPAFFGRGTTDTIEFILYDQADNILPQGKDGKKVRYVDITDKEAIRRYILIVRPQVSNKPNEYFVDVEKLINEAGYKNGIFKTQVTLLNKRVGSEKKTNKLWVHEISPSRTEIRVLPLKVQNKRLQNDILTRYDIFLRDGEFRDDIVNRIQSFQSTLNAETVKQTLQNAYGEDWVNLVKSEFQVPDIDDFLRRVVEKAKEAINYFIDGKEYKINSGRYGEPLKRKTNAALDIMKLYKVSNIIVCDIIESFLPKRNIIKKTYSNPIMLESRDKLGQILQQFTSNKTLDTSASVVARVVKPRPVKRGNVVVKPPPPPPPKPVIIKTPPKIYYFYQCNGNGKIGIPSRSSFSKGIIGPSKGGGGGCYQMLSAFFMYEDMNGNQIKFNLKPGSSSKICALEGSVKVSGGGTFVKKELCKVKSYKPIIVTPKPYIPPPPPPKPPPIRIKPSPILNLPIKFPPIKLDFPPIKPFPPIKWPIIPTIGVGGDVPLYFQSIKNPPKRGIDLSTSNPPTILTAPDLDQGEPDGMFNEGTGKFETMNGGARAAGMGAGGGMGTFGGYRKTSFGSGFSPFGSNYSGY